MHRQRQTYPAAAILAFSIVLLASLACGSADAPTWAQPPITQIVAVTQVVPVTQVVLVTQVVPGTRQLSTKPELILQRLDVSFLGQDGHKVIGSGCPGTDGKGGIVDHHLLVSNVADDKTVERIIVTGDNSTLTWEKPCDHAWGLAANVLGNGNWEIFIAPSLPSRVYTVMIFYDDNSFALGMDTAP